MDDTQPAILSLRQDLRLEDNPALQVVPKHPLLALYIWDEEDPSPPGGVVAEQKLKFSQKFASRTWRSICLEKRNPPRNTQRTHRRNKGMWRLLESILFRKVHHFQYLFVD